MSNRDLSRRAFFGAAALFATTAKGRGVAAAASDSPPPVLYVSHGAPIFALNDPGRIAELRSWGSRLSRPRGIVVMTPHFASRRLALGRLGQGAAMYNLPEPIKGHVPPNLDYVTPSNERLAARLDVLAGQTPLSRSEGRRGFDHTTWMPLACLFPAADVPVVELTYPYLDDPSLFSLGKRLAPLRDEGILFVASGGMTHNLASMDFGATPSAPPAWSQEFDAWATERLTACDVDALIDWRSRAPAQSLAHPDDGAHYRVLLVALGVALGAGSTMRTAFPIVGYESTLSKRSVQMN